MQLRCLVVAVGAVLALVSTQVPAEREGIDCGCDATGDYVTPLKFAVPQAVQYFNIEDETYGHGDYTVTIGTQSAPTGASVTVVITKGSTTCASFTGIVLDAGWGFSPDGHRFVVHSRDTNGSYHIRLYDLQKPSGANPYALFDSVDVSSAALGFSQSGRYFACAVKTSQSLYLGVFDVLAPTSRKIEIPSMTAIDHAGWGFSPSKVVLDDPAFFWAMQHNTGITARLVNLQTLAEYDVGADAGTWWGFSPCGDLFATVNGPAKSAVLNNTGTGQEVARGGWTGMAQDLKPRCDASYHYIGETQLCPNTAGAECQGGGEDTQAPTWPSGAKLIATDIYPASIRLEWTPAQDNVGVTRYQIYQDGELVEMIDGDATAKQVYGLQSATEYTFKVEAGDMAGNWSSDGPNLTVETVDCAPIWPAEADTTVADITETGAVLHWTAAEDDLGVTGYRVYRYGSDTPVGEVGATSFSFHITGLDPWTDYTYYVSAGDASDNWTKGPGVSFRTLDITPPYWPLPKHLSADSADATSVSLTWSDAEDNVGVYRYNLYVQRDAQWQLVAQADTRPMRLTCLTPDTQFVFKVEACDYAGNESTDGPTAVVSTTDGPVDCSGSMERVSVNSEGQETIGAHAPPSDWDPLGWAPHESENCAISADGRFVAFESLGINLVPNDMNTLYLATGPFGWDAYWNSDVFVRDRLTGATERVSVSSDGQEGNIEGSSSGCGISADGRFVVFDSTCDNLVPDDTNEKRDVFIHDRQTHTTQRVSVMADGTQANNHSGGWKHTAAVSADGRFVAFVSNATNLVPGDTNRKSDIFVKDMQTGAIERVSRASDGTQANQASWGVDMSADGRYVCFVSDARNLVPEDTDSTSDVYVHDRRTGTTSIVSVSTEGQPAQGDCCQEGTTLWPARISDDGRHVVFDSVASNLVADDANDEMDVFVHDRWMGITKRVSIASSGIEGDDYSRKADISGNGRFVAFESKATTLTGKWEDVWLVDVFLHDTILGTTAKLSRCPCGQDGDASSYRPSVNADGTVTAFESYAANLLVNLGDTNQDGDVFAVTQEVAPAVDVTVELSYVPIPAGLNKRTICTARLVNLGPDTSHNLAMTFEAPEGVAVSGAAAAQGTCTIDGRTVYFSIDSLAWQQHADVQIDLVPAVESSFLVSAAVACDTMEVYADNNQTLLEILVGETAAPDFNSDGRTDMQDLAIFSMDWANEAAPFADLYEDGAVTLEDLLVLMASWLANGS